MSRRLIQRLVTTQYALLSPEGWGDSAAYVELMRSRYRHLMHGQRMMVTASFARREPIQVTGPFADEAMKIISSMKMNKAKPTALSV